MPTQSKKQFRFIQAMRAKYNSKDKAPEKMKWVFDSEWTDVNYDKLPERKIYKSIFKEENSLSELNDISLVDKIIDFFMKNPYPKDHSQLHAFAKSINVEADIIEQYVYAILSCFIIGGNFNKSGKSEKDFSEEEKNMGLKVEYEHVDMKTNNEVVKYISNYFSKRISYDHLTELSNYYTLLNEMESSNEKL